MKSQNRNLHNAQESICCNLSEAAFRERRETVLKSLMSQTLESVENEDGYSFKFNGSNEILDELVNFIKAERSCCEFLHFNLNIGKPQQEIWLEITGPEGAKDFIAQLFITN